MAASTDPDRKMVKVVLLDIGESTSIPLVVMYRTVLLSRLQLLQVQRFPGEG
jgi:hypothetical protein